MKLEVEAGAGVASLREALATGSVEGCSASRVSCAFVNELKTQVRACWVKEDGTWAHERLIAPGTQHTESTFTTHGFVVCRDDELIVSYVPTKPDARHEVAVCEGRVVVKASPQLFATRPTYSRRSVKGFAVDADSRLLEDDVRDFLDDCEAAVERMPEHLRRALSETTRFVVHSETGPDFRDCCYHPADGTDWLETHGFPPDLAGCIHVYRLADYRRDRHLWGAGGVLVHELAHAVHDKCLYDGHQNRCIKARYQDAMRRGLYDLVEVKTLQSGRERRKHYACTDPAEFFAELSTAFLEPSPETSFNKWAPFNRPELERCDPATANLLERVWLRADPLKPAFAFMRGADLRPPLAFHDDDDYLARTPPGGSSRRPEASAVSAAWPASWLPLLRRQSAPGERLVKLK